MRDREISYGLARPRRRGRLRHPHVHRRHPGRRRPPARQAQRLLHPAAAHASARSSTRSRGPGGGATSSPPRSSSSPRCRRPAARSASCSTPRWTRRSASTTSRSSARCGRARSSSRACRTSRTRGGSSTSASTAIVLSNHGGRQLDRAPIPFHLLPEVVREVGKDAEVMIDTGIMNGADIVASIALGAKFTLDRPRLPLRPHGRRARGRRPHDRDPARPRSCAR